MGNIFTRAGLVGSTAEDLARKREAGNRLHTAFLDNLDAAKANRALYEQARQLQLQKRQLKQRDELQAAQTAQAQQTQQAAQAQQAQQAAQIRARQAQRGAPGGPGDTLAPGRLAPPARAMGGAPGGPGDTLAPALRRGFADPRGTDPRFMGDTYTPAAVARPFPTTVQPPPTPLPPYVATGYANSQLGAVPDVLEALEKKVDVQARPPGRGLQQAPGGLGRAIGYGQSREEVKKPFVPAAPVPTAPVSEPALPPPVPTGSASLIGSALDFLVPAAQAQSQPPNVRRFVGAMSSLPQLREAAEMLKIPPGWIIAQAALETGWGKSAPGNNLFGVKAQGKYRGARTQQRTREVIDGKDVYITDAFRAYDDPGGSILDYARLIKNSKRYKNAVGSKTAEEYFGKLQRGGYATDPDYATIAASVANRVEAALAATGMVSASAGLGEKVLDSVAPAAQASTSAPTREDDVPPLARDAQASAIEAQAYVPRYATPEATNPRPISSAADLEARRRELRSRDARERELRSKDAPALGAAATATGSIEDSALADTVGRTPIAIDRATAAKVDNTSAEQFAALGMQVNLQDPLSVRQARLEDQILDYLIRAGINSITVTNPSPPPWLNDVILKRAGLQQGMVMSGFNNAIAVNDPMTAAKFLRDITGRDIRPILADDGYMLMEGDRAIMAKPAKSIGALLEQMRVIGDSQFAASVSARAQSMEEKLFDHQLAMQAKAADEKAAVQLAILKESIKQNEVTSTKDGMGYVYFYRKSDGARIGYIKPAGLDGDSAPVFHSQIQGPEGAALRTDAGIRN